MEMKSVNREQARIARRADLYSYLLSRFPDRVTRVGTSLVHLKDHDSVYVKRGFSGYNAFSSGDHGNPIDFLLKYLQFPGYVEAVTELYLFETGRYPANAPAPAVPLSSSPGPPSPSLPRPMAIPPPDRPPFRRMYRYLQSRGIPEEFLDQLVDSGVLYQEAQTGNAVFISPEHDCCELRGTGSKPFHGVRRTSSNRFWYWNPHPGIRADLVFVTEGAIDALSLCLLHRQVGFDIPCVYVSIAGVANQRTIDRIKKQRPTVLAVDNDSAGEGCRARNPELPFILPRKKDWNEDLREGFPLPLVEESVIPSSLQGSRHDSGMKQPVPV